MVKLKLKVLWFKELLGLAIDQNIEFQSSPITSYYIWPKTEAWEQLKLELDSRPWLSSKEKVKILNLTTEIINYWHKKRETESLDKIIPRFKEISFLEIDN